MKTKNRKTLKIILFAVLFIAAVAAVVLAVVGPRTLLRVLRYGRSPEDLPPVPEAVIQAAFEDILEKNPEATDYVENYSGVTDYDLTIDLTGELTPGEIPYLTQWDSRWGYCRYSGGLVGYTGCGPTCLSMVLMGLTGDGTKTPAYVADFATRYGYSVEGNGTSWTLFSDGAKQLGLTVKEIPLWEDDMRYELNSGRPIICIMGKGHFTETGHFIVLYGCDDQGFEVYDPYRPSNCKVWSYDEIEGEIRNIWSYTV